MQTKIKLGLVVGLALWDVEARAIESRFDQDAEGWTHSGAAVFQQRSAGGNGGGFLYIDNSEGPVTYIHAPPKFLGDLSAFNGGTISFDGIQLGAGGDPWPPNPLDYGHIWINSVSIDVLPAPRQPGPTWATYSGRLTAAAFGTSETEWKAILKNVTAIQISVESLFGAEIEGIDNVVITLAGDYNGDGLIDEMDLDMLIQNIRNQNRLAESDVNEDSKVDNEDLYTWVREIKGTYIGDANLDGEFNSSDFVRVFTAGKYEVPSTANWGEGDWNADSLFDSSDFVQAFSDGGYEIGPRRAIPAFVPEPSAAWLLTLSLSAVLLRCRSVPSLNRRENGDIHPSRSLPQARFESQTF